MSRNPILSQVKEYKAATIATPFFSVVEVTVEIIIPYITANIIDDGIAARDLGVVRHYGIIMLILAFVSLIFGTLGAWFSAYASTGFAKNMREAMYETIQTYSFANIDKFSTAGLITRLTTDVNNIQAAFIMVVRIAIRAPIMLIVSLIMCLTINRNISLMFFSIMVVVAAVFGFIGVRVARMFREVFKRYDALNASVQENVSAIRVVKSFVREDYEDEKFMHAALNLYKMFVKTEKRMISMVPGIMMSIILVVVGICWFGAHYIVDGTMTTGDLTALFSYILSTVGGLIMFIMVFVMISMSRASADRITEVLTEESDITSPENPVMTVKDGSVQFDHVSFSYRTEKTREEQKLENEKKTRRSKRMEKFMEEDDSPFADRRRKLAESLAQKNQTGAPVLSDITFIIGSGETIGLIGSTASGKSSLVNLISRLYDAEEGTVSVGGRDVRDYDIGVLRDNVSVVLQKNELFSGTVRENLQWGNENASDEEILEALQISCADDFVLAFPEGLDHLVEQGGANLSGGQKQRLCIARALLKSPKVLILDDSTSAVDTATEAKILNGFREIIPETTKIIISQRISSVRDADRILVLDNGTLVGCDTHDELLKNNVIYQEIYESQQKASQDFDAFV